jgi:hypothetical protein
MSNRKLGITCATTAVAALIIPLQWLQSGTLDGGHLSITAQALYEEYERNELAADQKYSGRQINVGGIVQKIGKEKDGTPYVIFRCSQAHTSSGGQTIPIVMSGDGIQCFFDPRYIPRLINLQPGRTFSVYGKVDGKRGRDVIVKDCTF